MPRKQILLKEHEEIVGKLLSVHIDEIVLKIDDDLVRMLVPDSETFSKLRKLLGQEIGIIRLGGRYYIRRTGTDCSELVTQRKAELRKGEVNE